MAAALPAFGLALAIAGCDQVAKFALPSVDPAQPIVAPSDAAPPRPNQPAPGRAVATLPSSRLAGGLT